MYNHKIHITLNEGSTAHREYMVRFSGYLGRDLNVDEILEWDADSQKWEDDGAISVFRVRAALREVLEQL
jgi:hypothetical protein